MSQAQGDASDTGKIGCYTRKLAARVRTAIHDRSEQLRLREEFRSILGANHEADVLEALRLPRGQIEAFIEGHPAAKRLLPRMAKQLGIGLDTVTDNGTRNEIMVNCAVCTAKKSCAKWLDAYPCAEPPEFCRNGPEFDRLLHPRKAAG